MSGLYELAAEVKEWGSGDPDYIQRMIHKIPRVPSINRLAYLLRAVKGKSILDIGCTGQISAELRKAARAYHGLDMVDVPGLEHFTRLDLEQAEVLPEIDGLDLMIASEILEHLGNALHFLELLRAAKKPAILTVPNAFSEAGYTHARQGKENVNREHVAYYSYYTLSELVRRAGFALREWFWYGEKEYIAEGLLFCLE